MLKLYFYDTGLACTLLGLEKETQLESHYLKGALFENLIALEILKGRTNNAVPPNIYFWRDHTGHEIDLVGEWGGEIHAMAIKFAKTFQTDYIKNLQYFIALCRSKSKEQVKRLFTLQWGSRWKLPRNSADSIK